MQKGVDKVSTAASPAACCAPQAPTLLPPCQVSASVESHHSLALFCSGECSEAISLWPRGKTVLIAPEPLLRASWSD
jgi:hypothetical protein